MHHVIWMSVAKVTSVTATRKLKTFVIATVLLLRGSKRRSLNQGKLTLRSIEPLLGRANESTHIPGTQGSSNIRQIGLSCYFHYYAYGAAFLLIDWIPLINKPAVLYLFYSQGPKYSATLNFGINTKLNLHRA